MGLLNRVGRKAANFLDGAGEAMGRRADPMNYTNDRFAPLASATQGGIVGAGAGAAASPDDPLGGALAGGALGLGAGVGLSLARQGAAGLAGGFRNVAELGAARPDEIASTVLAVAQRQGPAAAQQMLVSIQKSNPALFEQVLQFLN